LAECFRAFSSLFLPLGNLLAECFRTFSSLFLALSSLLADCFFAFSSLLLALSSLFLALGSLLAECFRTFSSLFLALSSLLAECFLAFSSLLLALSSLFLALGSLLAECFFALSSSFLALSSLFLALGSLFLALSSLLADCFFAFSSLLLALSSLFLPLSNLLAEFFLAFKGLSDQPSYGIVKSLDVSTLRSRGGCRAEARGGPICGRKLAQRLLTRTYLMYSSRPSCVGQGRREGGRASGTTWARRWVGNDAKLTGSHCRHSLRCSLLLASLSVCECGANVTLVAAVPPVRGLARGLCGRRIGTSAAMAIDGESAHDSEHLEHDLDAVWFARIHRCFDCFAIVHTPTDDAPG